MLRILSIKIRIRAAPSSYMHRTWLSVNRNVHLISICIPISLSRALWHALPLVLFVRDSLIVRFWSIIKNVLNVMMMMMPGCRWVEHDPMEILDTVRKSMEGAIAKAKGEGINFDGCLKAIGITNQRETTVMWSKSTGKPYYNAIVWMDSRTSSICRYPPTFSSSIFCKLLNFFGGKSRLEMVSLIMLFAKWGACLLQIGPKE